MARLTSQKPESPASTLLSQQVSESRYFFLSLRPSRGEVLSFGGREHCNPDYAIDRNDYAYHVLEYVASGRGEITLNGKKHALGPGCVFAYAPNTPCALKADPIEPMVKYFVCLSGKQVGRMLRGAELEPGRVRRLHSHGEIRGVFDELIQEGQRGETRTREICGLLFELLLLRLASAVTETARSVGIAHENFLRCKVLIDEQTERLNSLDEIATAVGLDISSVSRLFRRYQGTSPYQYLLRRKMNLAAEFLVNHGGLVKEAARRAGFFDPYHFSRCFKNIHGIAPREMRNGR